MSVMVVELLLRGCLLLVRYFAVGVGSSRSWHCSFLVPLCTKPRGCIGFADGFLARMRLSHMERGAHRSRGKALQVAAVGSGNRADRNYDVHVRMIFAWQ